MASTITVPSAADLGAYADEVNTGILAQTGQHDPRIAKALIAVATAAVADIETLQAATGDGLTDDAPANVTKAAAAVGTSEEAARADHKHDITTAAAGAIAVGDAAAEGAATSLARSDHVHSLAAPAAPADVTKAAASAGAATTVARADHKHDVSTAAAVSVALANAEGSASSLARSDHTHNSGNQQFDLTLDGVGGTATKNTGIVVTANTRAIVTLTTPGAGASGTRYAVSYVIGGAGVGAVTVTAKDSGAGDNTVNTDNSVLAVTLIEALPIA